MREPRTFEIEKTSYTITPMPPDEGLPIFVRLTKILGSSLGEGLKGADVDKLGEMEISQLGEMIDLGGLVKELVGRMDEREIMDSIKVLLDGRFISWKGTKAGEGGVVTLAQFAGDYGLMFKLLAKVLEVNYGSFLDVLKSAFGSAVASAKKAQKKS